MKLVGDYRHTVAGVDVGTNPKTGKAILKLSLDCTEEWRNGQWIPLEQPVRVNSNQSLSTVPGSRGKSPAQRAVESLRKAYDFKGGYSDLMKLVFSQGIAVCEDHSEGDFTRVKYLNHINDPHYSGNFMAGGGLQEFGSDVKSELEKIFAAVG